jgi:hypothetical protein
MTDYLCVSLFTKLSTNPKENQSIIPRKEMGLVVVSAKYDPAGKSEKVTELILTLMADIDAFTERTVATIRREIGTYQDFPLSVHLADNTINLKNVLDGLMSFAPADRSALEHAHFMGRQRALAGVRLSSATQGYHVAYGAVWRELLQLAEASEDAEIMTDLTRYVAPLWDWFQTVSGAFARAYLDTEASLKATRTDKRAILYEAFRSSLTSEDRAREAAVSLGFDPLGPFTVLVSSPLDPGQVESIVKQFTNLGKGLDVIAVAPETVVVTQRGDATDIVEILLSAGSVDGVGIGRLTQGLHAASLGYSEAKRAFACTSHDVPIAHFSKVWATAMASEREEVVIDLLRAGLMAAQSSPHIADTVSAFTANRFSLASTARAVHLHPNTTKYRLQRWKELTGWDVYTVEGLLNSVLSLELARLGYKAAGESPAVDGGSH